MTHAKRLIIKKISLSYFVKNESKYTKMHLSKLYNANTNKENSYEKQADISQVFLLHVILIPKVGFVTQR